MGLIDEFRSTLANEDARDRYEPFAEHRLIQGSNTLTAAPAATHRNVETATKRLADLATSLDALPLAEHIDRLLGTAPKGNPYVSDLATSLGRNDTPATPSVINGQVELLHRQIDTLSSRLKALSALVQRLGAV